MQCRLRFPLSALGDSQTSSILIRTIDRLTPHDWATKHHTYDPGLYFITYANFRCHNSGATGGTKAGLAWQHLAGSAKKRPDYFGKWVHNPQSVNPGAKMPPNLQYDQPTLNALTRYFQTFAP